MIKKILYKIFKLEDEPCRTCEILQIELARERDEKNFILMKLLESKRDDVPSVPPGQLNEPQSIRSTFVPWRVRKEALEAESRRKAELLNKFKTENPTITTANDVTELEKEIIGGESAS